MIYLGYFLMLLPFLIIFIMAWIESKNIFVPISIFLITFLIVFIIFTGANIVSKSMDIPYKVEYK